MEDFSKLNKLVIEDAFMIRTVENVTSIWFTGLHKKLHISVSHRAGDEFWNLHITKNEGDPTTKPKIGICKIRAEGLEEDFINFCRYFILQLLEPVDRSTRKNSYLITFTGLKSGKSFYRLRKGMQSTLRKCSKRVGKKEFRILTNAETEFTALATSREQQNRILSYLRRVPRRFRSKLESGILISEKECHGVIAVGGKLYKMKQGDEATAILLSMIHPNLRLGLLKKIHFAIPRLLWASTYAQVERWDNPDEICIIENPSKTPA